MQTIFPEGPGVSGMFFTGYRMRNEACALTGTAIVKRGYRIDPAGKRLLPLENHYPVFIKDYPFNLVKNGCFENRENGLPLNWQIGGIDVSYGTSNAVPYIRVKAESGNRNIIQTVEVEDCPAGKSYVFSFWAKGDNLPAYTGNVRLECDGVSICSMPINLETTFRLFSARACWPAGLNSKKIDVILKTASSPDKPVSYTGVQVEEGTRLSCWDPETVFKYEHDLAPFKEKSDIIVLGYDCSAEYNCLKVDDITVLERYEESPPPFSPSGSSGDISRKSLFGWEPRVNSIREEEAGEFPPGAEEYPPSPPLPGTFKNIFYNGYARNLYTAPEEMKYLRPGAGIRIERPPAASLEFKLPAERYLGTYYYPDAARPDDRAYWKTESFPLYADTLVIEPEEKTCYLVWRGHWNLNDHQPGAYRLLEVSRISS